jgi:hypothetical protein
MTIAEQVAYFDLLTDKVGNPYFTDAEKYSFISQAAVEYVKRTLPSNEGGVMNLEFSHIIFSNLSTLVFETGALSMNSSGEITTSAVQTALNTASSSTEPFMFVMNVGSDGEDVRYVPHNNWFATINNTFKVQDICYKQLANKFVFNPVNLDAGITFTLLKQPKTVGVGTDCDLPPHTHKTVTELAVELASVSIRDSELNQANQIQLNS